MLTESYKIFSPSIPMVSFPNGVCVRVLLFKRCNCIVKCFSNHSLWFAQITIHEDFTIEYFKSFFFKEIIQCVSYIFRKNLIKIVFVIILLYRVLDMLFPIFFGIDEINFDNISLYNRAGFIHNEINRVTNAEPTY